MNQQDRNRMAELYSCVANLPWPNRNRTIGPRELSRFYQSMEDITPQLLHCIMAISRADAEYSDPDDELRELRALTVDRMSRDDGEG